MVNVALFPTFDSPKVAKANSPSLRCYPSFFAGCGDVLFGRLVSFSTAAFFRICVYW